MENIGNTFEQTVYKAVEKHIDKKTIDNVVKEVILANAKLPREVRITVVQKDGSEVTVARQHEYFPLVLAAVTAGVPLALTGPAGSGKTSICINVAESLGLPFFIMPFNPLSSKTDLLGYCSASGDYIPSALYRAVKDGGMFIADEFDAADPGVAIILNGIIANRLCTFPNGETVRAHETFLAICCMNTVGLGATSQYVGRNALDAATLDRFAVLYIGYDEALESHLVGIDSTTRDIIVDEGGIPTTQRILDLVRSARSFSAEKKWYNIISPRASLLGCALARAGVGEKWIRSMLLGRGLSKEQKQELRGRLQKITKEDSRWVEE